MTERPWGSYEVIQTTKDYQLKRIEILPGKRLSLQRHKYRAEQWFIISGSAMAVVDNRTLVLKPGDTVGIPAGTIHRIGSYLHTPVVMIEVQTGTYFGEDDIERLEDDFNRCTEA